MRVSSKNPPAKITGKKRRNNSTADAGTSSPRSRAPYPSLVGNRNHERRSTTTSESPRATRYAHPIAAAAAANFASRATSSSSDSSFQLASTSASAKVITEKSRQFQGVWTCSGRTVSQKRSVRLGVSARSPFPTDSPGQSLLRRRLPSSSWLSVTSFASDHPLTSSIALPCFDIPRQCISARTVSFCGKVRQTAAEPAPHS